MTRIQNLNDELQTVPESDRKTWSSFFWLSIFFKNNFCEQCCWSASFRCRSGSGSRSHFPLWCRSRSDSFSKFYTWRKIRIFVLTFVHITALLYCFIFVTSVIGVIIFNVLDSILKYFGKSIVYLYIWLKWIQIRIVKPWMPICIRIRQNDVDPTESGSTTHRVLSRSFVVRRQTRFWRMYCQHLLKGSLKDLTKLQEGCFCHSCNFFAYFSVWEQNCHDTMNN